jgi:hypothetical protein
MHALLPIPGGKRDSDWSYSWVPVVGPILGALLAAAFLRLTITKGSPRGFLLEMPKYQLPHLRDVLLHAEPEERTVPAAGRAIAVGQGETSVHVVQGGEPLSVRRQEQ